MVVIMTVPTAVLTRHKAGFQRRIETMPELFDLNFWRNQESYLLIQRYCNPSDSILEVGCLNGHHCLLLSLDGYKNVVGIEFNSECIKMAEAKKMELGLDGCPKFICGEFPTTSVTSRVDKILLFDVIEHVTNLQSMFEECARLLKDSGQVLVLVPRGKFYYDSGHINFWPDEESLTNHLSIYFNVTECISVESGQKLFASCNLRS
jgi:2-polyprenyl-3-methyl-5-hydroxy-6-metoxy-1,4-benzoquinol methylase